MVTLVHSNCGKPQVSQCCLLFTRRSDPKQPGLICGLPQFDHSSSELGDGAVVDCAWQSLSGRLIHVKISLKNVSTQPQCPPADISYAEV